MQQKWPPSWIRGSSAVKCVIGQGNRVGLSNRLAKERCLTHKSLSPDYLCGQSVLNLTPFNMSPISSSSQWLYLTECPGCIGIAGSGVQKGLLQNTVQPGISESGQFKRLQTEPCGPIPQPLLIHLKFTI